MAQPHPTDHIGLIRIPGPGLTGPTIRYSPLSNRPNFNPTAWPQHPLTPSTTFPGWWEIDLDTLGLADGVYEYEFLANGSPTPIPDPYADWLTRFGGYRGLLTIAGGKRQPQAFDWTGEFVSGINLPQNNQIVIYEMPVKWMSSDPTENAQLVELGTIDKVIFEHLADLASMGINCIELLPIEDSPQTLNWGYGTRFFFAPDYDIGHPIDVKFFVKQCHQRGIRVFLDVVMNMYSPKCPLGALAMQWYNTPSTPSRQDWGQELFLYDTPAYDNYYAAQEFLCEMAEYWVTNYHIDGYRIDDFADINNWDFIQTFYNRATARNQLLFPSKPFHVIAEDSDGRFVTTSADPGNPNAQPVVDAIWNFMYQAEIRRFATDSIETTLGQPSRTLRVQHFISMEGTWNDWNKQFDPGYWDMSCSVDYVTSHDVQTTPRLMNVILGPMLVAAGFGDGGVQNVQMAVDGQLSANADAVAGLVSAALQRVFGIFAVLMTSVGMPMFLAGEEFGDVHDTTYVDLLAKEQGGGVDSISYTDVNSKQQDPIQWARAQYPANALLKANVAKLIQLRTTNPALQRNEIQFFYFHPHFDDDNSPRVFCYCRTAGQSLGSTGQVIVIVNMGAEAFPTYGIPGWPWAGMTLTEYGYPATSPAYDAPSGTLSLSLNAFSARVFTT